MPCSPLEPTCEEGCDLVPGFMTRAECVSVRFHEGEKPCVDKVHLDILYTPGHTNDCSSFLLSDRVFTGDTVLIRGTGRTDFQNGDQAAQYDILFGKLLTLSGVTPSRAGVRRVIPLETGDSRCLSCCLFASAA